MNSIGVFKEVEINGNPAFVFTLDSPNSSDGAATDSGGGGLPLQPLFLCPMTRFYLEARREEINRRRDEDKFLPFHDSPHFPDSGLQDESLPDDFLPDECLPDESLHEESLPEESLHEIICKLPVLPLYWCNNEEPDDNEKICICENRNVGTDYYFCVGCETKFHKECVESPLEIKHPFHPRHSLQLFLPPRGRDVCCVHCRTRLSFQSYNCTSCIMSLDPVCAMKMLPIVINHPKRHAHPLTFFPRQDSLACNVCGVIKKFNPTYVCVRCDFVAHRNCIYFPYVIRISRHLHRVAFTSSLPSGEWSCGVCRREVDNHYGAYTCQQCNNYFVHTRCALRGDVWDGKELEGVPEEPDIVVAPFERIADGIILHFTHGHHLRLEVSLIYDQTKICQACALPIYEGSFYACMDQCDFIFHDSCANAPRKIHHPLHPHPLTLKAVASEFDYGQFHCKACWQRGCGFVYECQVEKDCFEIHVMCASVSEPFHYHGHDEHPLYLALDPEEEPTCYVCKSSELTSKTILNCIECDFMVCFMCATLPYKVRYKHDKHYLTFYNWEHASESDWCEICEGKLIIGAEDLFYDDQYGNEGTTGFYGCNKKCCTTLHIHCLLGKHRHMKPGQTIRVDSDICHILHNNSNSRPICSGRRCQRRCPFNTVYKVDAQFFCCWDCVTFDRDAHE